MIGRDDHGAVYPVIVAPNAVAAVGRTQIAFAAVGLSGLMNVACTVCGLVVVATVPIWNLCVSAVMPVAQLAPVPKTMSASCTVAA